MIDKNIFDCYNLFMFDIKELVQILQDNKLKNISVYNLSTSNEEKYIVLSTSNKVVDSKKVADILAERFHYDEKIEGYFKGEWIVFDFPTVALHIFLPKVREKYNLDKLYKPKKINI